MASLIIIVFGLVAGFPIGALIGRWWVLAAGPMLGLIYGYGIVGDGHEIGPDGWALITAPLFTGGIAIGVMVRLAFIRGRRRRIAP